MRDSSISRDTLNDLHRLHLMYTCIDCCGCGCCCCYAANELRREKKKRKIAANKRSATHDEANGMGNSRSVRTHNSESYEMNQPASRHNRVSRARKYAATNKSHTNRMYVFERFFSIFSSIAVTVSLTPCIFSGSNNSRY